MIEALIRDLDVLDEKSSAVSYISGIWLFVSSSGPNATIVVQLSSLRTEREVQVCVNNRS